MTVSRQSKILHRAVSVLGISRAERSPGSTRSIRDVTQRHMTKRFPLHDNAIAVKKFYDDRIAENLLRIKPPATTRRGRRTAPRCRVIKLTIIVLYFWPADIGRFGDSVEELVYSLRGGGRPGPYRGLRAGVAAGGRVSAQR
jgi:hypothetical protein